MSMKVKCPTCNADVDWSSASAYRPFCSKRCQLIDLGEWADESNTIPVQPTPSDQGFDFDLLDEFSDHTNFFSANPKNH